MRVYGVNKYYYKTVCYRMSAQVVEVGSVAIHQTHNLKVTGSNPVPATKNRDKTRRKLRLLRVFLCLDFAYIPSMRVA